MNARTFAIIFGIFYTLVGVMGFIPGLVTQPAGVEPDLLIDALSGRLLGLFPVNIVHTIIHLLVGLWGIAAYRSFSASVTYARTLAVLFGILAVMGLIPFLNTTFGLAPLYSHDIWLHALTALAAAYFGFVNPGRRPAARM